MNEKILAIEIDQLTLSYLKRVLRENNSVEFSCFFKSWMHCDLALADKGIYNCHAENEVGEDEKTTVVDVVEPVTVIFQPEVKTPQEGATLELECNARGNPPPEITWFRDGKKVVADDEVYITDNGLVILSATRKMSGIWKCVAKNVANEIVLEHVINVEWPPSIVFPELPTSKSVKLGSQVILECPVDASPAPEFE
jgi:hypothetical protein